MKRFLSILLISFEAVTYPVNITIPVEEINIDAVKQEATIYIQRDNKDEKGIEQQKRSETAYVTKSGKCYHKGNCSCLKKSKIAMSKDDAVKNHYYECSKCFKPEEDN